MLFILLFLQCAALSLIISFYFKKYKLIKLTLLNFFLIYLLLIVNVYFYELYLEYKLSLFDLNGDGFFSEIESTKEKEKYMSLVINDTGRKFVVLTGLIFSFLYSIFFFVGTKLVTSFKENLKRNN